MIRKPPDVRLMLIWLKQLQGVGLDLFPLKRWDAKRDDGTLTGKTPRDKGWRDKDYADFDWKWWLQEGGNVGVRLGALDIVVDVDMHGDHDGIAALARLEGAVGRLTGPRFPMVRTGSGGYHIYLRLPEPMRTKVQVPGYEGIDFKRVGGFVVAPGSIHPKTKRPYMVNEWWANSKSVPIAPQALIDLLRRPEGHERTGDGGEISNEDLASLLACLDPKAYGGSDHYMDWISISAACFDATNGDGFEEWAEWCRLDPAYGGEGDENLLHHWDSFEAGRADGATYRSLLKAVVDAGRKDVVRLIGGDVRTTAAEDFADWDEVDLVTDEHGEYSPLFEITPDRRPELFTKGNRKLLARLWNLEKDVYAKLKEQWRAQRMPGVPEIDKGVVADGKEMVRLIRENRKEKKVEKAQDSGVRIINVKQHMTNARLLLGEDRPTLLRSNGTWWDWNGSAYREIEEESIRAEVYSFVGSAVNEEGEPIDANAAMVTNIMDAMSSANFHARTELTSPCWMDPKPDDLNATECLALRNGILHVPTRTLLPPDPRFFTYNGLSYDYEEPWEKGQPKEWLKFLNSVWHDTPDQIDALQEVFGVLLLPITKYQKVFELFGPSRSGKGTILRTLTNVVGPANVTGATLDELTNQGFGLETLIGKSLMTVTDSRIAPGGGTAALIQNLLRISGEDTVSIKRKYKGNWEGTLGIRIMVAGNIPLTLPDQANALTARLFPMRMDKSFVGSEDLGLADRIARELPQILNWSLDGYDRLTARGKFVLTETGHEIIDEMEVSANPVKLFMRECCVVDARAESRTGAIFDAFDAWQTHNNINPPRLEQQFGRALFSASNYTVKKVRHRTGSEHSQEYYYVGLRLLPEWEEKARKHKQGEDV